MLSVSWLQSDKTDNVDVISFLATVPFYRPIRTSWLQYVQVDRTDNVDVVSLLATVLQSYKGFLETTVQYSPPTLMQ